MNIEPKADFVSIIEKNTILSVILVKECNELLTPEKWSAKLQCLYLYRVYHVQEGVVNTLWLLLLVSGSFITNKSMCSLHKILS